MRSPAISLALSLLCTLPCVGMPSITEFMAANSGTLADEDGAFSDWIEITNPGATTVDLAGWYLTDDENFDVDDPESVWEFPGRDLAPGQSLLVFASGKDRAPAGAGELHTNFQLDSAGEYLALVMPDGTTRAAEFAPTYPQQETDISYGTGQVSLTTVGMVSEGGTVLVNVPSSGADSAQWRGAAEPYDDSAWTPRRTGIGFDAGGGPSGFTMLETFDSLDLGAIDGQGEWSASSGGATVGIDPADAENQVMAQTGSGVRAWRALDIPDGTTATIFFRTRRDGAVNISVGTTDQATPGTAFSEFECQLNNQNDDVLKVRDAGSFDDVGTFADGVWYNVWMVVNTASDTYEVFMRGGALAEQTQLDAAAQTMFGFRNGASSNPLRNFFARTGTPSTGAWSIDDIYLADGENLGDPIGGLSLDSFIHPEGDIEAAMYSVAPGAYLRVPFTVAPGSSFSGLTLRMRYDDGFVAYINGTQIGSRNAPAAPAWNGTATDEQSAQAVLTFEEIDVTSHVDLLTPGATNILAIHGLNLDASDHDFLLTPELVAVETDAEPARLYFTTPTPGASNGSGFEGFVGDTTFSVDRGFYNAPFDVVISSSTPGASIIYTTDGSAPSPANGTEVPAPATVPIDTTTPLRAAAFKDGFLATNIDTHTYIFVADVVGQGAAQPGYPTTWKGDGGNGSFPADYGMDPEITGSAAYGDVIDAALLAVPTISLVTDQGHFFDRGTGIYQNPQQRGSAWERPVSFEVIQPDGSRESIQVDAGIRIQGGHTRLPSKNPKHSFRVSFKSEFGAAKLDYDLFPGDPDAANEFDQLVLRGAGNQSWLHHNTFMGDNRGRAQYIRDQWAKDTQIAMGHPGTRSLYAHVYINGIYWGLYNPTERASAGFGESYLGGEKEDYYALNSGDAIDGANARADYSSLIALANGGLADPAEYSQIAERLDLVAFTDYMLIQQYGGNKDWDHHNWYAIRNSDGGKWYFICWDSEFVFINATDNVLGLDNSDDPSRIWRRLLENDEYRLLFADRVQKHFSNGGLLTPGGVTAIWEARKDQMFDAIVGESARWGDYRRDVHPVGSPSPIPLYDRDQEWAAERSRLFGSYFPVRTDNVLAQYRAAGYLSDLGPPVFATHGGRVAPGFQLGISAPGGGEIYYTLDGSDPRVRAEVSTVNLIAEGATMTVFAPTSDALGTSWRGGAEPFDDSAWASGTAAGFDSANGRYLPLLDIDMRDAMFGKTPSCYVRMTFEIPDQATLDAVVSMTLGVRYDDGFAAFINGIDVASDRAPNPLAWDSPGSSHPDSQAVIYQPFELGSAAVKALHLGTNVLTFHAFNAGESSSDFLIDATLSATVSATPSLSPGAILYSEAVSLDESVVLRARARDGNTWSALTEASFFVGDASSDQNLVISEIHYNPDGLDGTEFIELQNIAAGPIDLSGVRFSEGIDFDFPIGTVLPAGGRVLIVRDLSAFEAEYGVGMPVAGSFANGTALDNGGERLTILAEDGSLIRTLRYNDNSPWPAAADGSGHSLVLLRPETNPDHERPENWRLSGQAGGNPGATDRTSFVGDPNLDADADGLSAFLEYALGTSDSSPGDLASAFHLDGQILTVRRSLTAEDVSLILEQSKDLQLWVPAPHAPTSDIPIGNGTLRSSYTIETADQVFLRLRVEGR